VGTATGVKVRGKAHPRTGHEDREGGAEAYLYSFFNLNAKLGWVVNTTPWSLYTREREPVPIVQETAWDPGPVWTGTGNLAYHRDPIPGPSSP